MNVKKNFNFINDYEITVNYGQEDIFECMLGVIRMMMAKKIE